MPYKINITERENEKYIFIIIKTAQFTRQEKLQKKKFKSKVILSDFSFVIDRESGEEAQ